MENFGKFCFGVIIAIASTLINGFVFMRLWEWFIVRAFEVRPLTLIQAIGLMLIWWFVKPKSDRDEKLTISLMQKRLIGVIIGACLTLALGYIVLLFQ